MTLGVLMPDPGMSMFTYDPIMGQNYIQGGVIDVHKNSIDPRVMRLIRAHQEGMSYKPSYRSGSIGLLKKELHQSLDDLPERDRIKQFNYLYELYRELCNEQIDRMLDSL